jgi:predicted amidophosphoribosyltransferase
MRMIDYVIALGDLMMPRACLACGRRLGMRERHLCLSCAADVPYTRFWLAAHNPLADRFNAVLERHRGTEPMDYAYAAALLYYKGAYRSIPRALKYQGNLAAGRHYGALLGRRLAAAPHFADIDLVIPVPLHWTRLRSRGYNQAEILARALVDAFCAAPSTVIPGLTRNLPEVRTDLLVRARRTRTQTRVSVDQKAQNVASAFQVPARFTLWTRFLSLSKDAPESPAEVLASARHILLVDDTFTTGATLYACYAALRPFTTARISIATLAAVEGTPSGTGGP